MKETSTNFTSKHRLGKEERWIKSIQWPRSSKVPIKIPTKFCSLYNMLAEGCKWQVEVDRGNQILESGHLGNVTQLRQMKMGKQTWIDITYCPWIQLINFLARMTLKFYGWSQKQKGTSSILLQAFFHSGVTVWKCSIWFKIGYILSLVTLKFGRWPCKTIGHPSYGTSSFVLYFVAISVFKLELQSRNDQIGSKLVFFVLCNLEI